MVQLTASSVASPKTPKMAKAKTPKNGAVATPAKTEVKTPKQAKNTPAKAALQTPKMKEVVKEAKSTPKMKEAVKEAKSTPKIVKSTPKIIKEAKSTPKIVKEAKGTPKAAPQTPKNGTASAKKAKKVKTPKQKPAEDVEMESEGEEEAAPAESPVKTQQSPKKSTKKVKSEDAEMSSEEEEIKVKSGAPKQKANSNKKAGEFTLFVRGLNFNTNEESVFKHFSSFGKVAKCSIPLNPSKKNLNKGFGFVEYDSQAAMDKALTAIHTVDSRSLVVKKSDPEEASGKRKRDESTQRGGDGKRQAIFNENELFVAKISPSSTKESVEDHFSQFGEIVRVTLPMRLPDKTSHKGFAFVEFKDASSVAKAAVEEKQELDSATIAVRPSQKPLPKKNEAPAKQSLPNELFVRALNYQTQRNTVESHFSKYGKIAKVTLPWNKMANTNKGFGFVAFETAESVEAALAEDHEIDGKIVAVKSSQKDSEKNGAASEKVETKKVKAEAKKVKAAPAKMEEDDDDEDEEMEGDEADSEEGDDEEVEGEEDDDSDEGEDEEVEGEDDDDDDEVEGEEDDDEVEGEEDDDEVEGEEDDDEDDDDDDEDDE